MTQQGFTGTGMLVVVDVVVGVVVVVVVVLVVVVVVEVVVEGAGQLMHG